MPLKRLLFSLFLTKTYLYTFVFLESKDVLRHEEVVVNAVVAINNVSYYTTQDCAQMEAHTNIAKSKFTCAALFLNCFVSDGSLSLLLLQLQNQ